MSTNDFAYERVIACTIIRTIEDLNLVVPNDPNRHDLIIREAQALLNEIDKTAINPPKSYSIMINWIRARNPLLLGWADQADRLNQPERAQAYRAIVALRLLVAETAANLESEREYDE